MKRDKIYRRVQESTYGNVIGASLANVPSIPNVDYWFVGIKSAAVEMDTLLADCPPEDSKAHWGAILSTCVLCMMQNGVVRRGLGPLSERIVIRGPATLKDVVVVINGERDYQDSSLPHRMDGTNAVYGYNIMLDTYLRKAIDAWTNSGVYHALDEIRKLAGICVHCLEDCYVE